MLLDTLFHTLILPLASGLSQSTKLRGEFLVLYMEAFYFSHRLEHSVGLLCHVSMASNVLQHLNISIIWDV